MYKYTIILYTDPFRSNRVGTLEVWFYEPQCSLISHWTNSFRYVAAEHYGRTIFAHGVGSELEYEYVPNV